MKALVDDHGNGFERVVWKNRPLVFFDGKPSKRIPSMRYLSAELETTGLVQANPKTFEELNVLFGKRSCPVVFDGSLDRVLGFEVNMSPASGDAYIALLGELCAALRNANALIDERCGTHVHIDCRDFNNTKVRRFSWLYSLVEPALFQLLPEHRKASKFCQPCGYELTKATLTKKFSAYTAYRQRLSQYLYDSPRDQDYRTVKGHTNYGRRRNALNVHSWLHRGTMEFRHLHGTLNPEKILVWSGICAALVEFIAQDKALRRRKWHNPKTRLIDVLKAINADDSLLEAVIGVPSKLGAECNAVMEQARDLKVVLTDGRRGLPTRLKPKGPGIWIKWKPFGYEGVSINVLTDSPDQHRECSPLTCKHIRFPTWDEVQQEDLERVKLEHLNICYKLFVAKGVNLCAELQDFQR